MKENIQISQRFCGPPNSANGGYTCGIMDNETDFVSEVTLRVPPPLEKQLTFQQANDQVQLMDQDTLVAYARPGTIDLAAPAAPDFETAALASQHYLGRQMDLAFPTCFVCGMQRSTGDGLQIYAGKADGEAIVAAPWVPFSDLGNDGHFVNNEFMWSALDCPGAYSVMGDQPKMIVLGRMTAQILKPVTIAERCVVIGWAKGQEGKKHFCGTAIYNSQQELCAVSNQIWFELKG